MRVLSLAVILSIATAIPAFACPPLTPHPEYLLVGNKGEDSISFINLETGRETRRVPVSGSAPHEIAVTPDGRFAAVVNYGEASIDIFDFMSESDSKTIDLGTNKNPHGLVALQNGGFLATTEGGKSIVQLMPNHGEIDLGFIRCFTFDWTVDPIPTGQQGTHMIAVSADNKIAYTANLGSGTVSRIELATKTVKSVPAGKEVEGIALSKDDSEVWASVRGEDKVVVYDSTSLKKLTEIKVGAFPLRILASPDGTKMVTSNLKDGTVSVIDVKTRKVERTIKVSGTDQTQQVTILFSANGKKLYVAETGINKIAEIDFETGVMIGRLSGGQQGDGLAIVPAFNWRE